MQSYSSAYTHNYYTESSVIACSGVSQMQLLRKKDTNEGWGESKSNGMGLE